MAQKPEDRYANAGEFREALRRMGRSNSAIGIVSEATTHGNPSAQSAEAPALKMAMVVSARRFGPGAATAVLVVLLMVIAGVFYGSQRWFDAPPAVVTEAAPVSLPMLRQSAVARKPERSRSIESSGATAAKAKSVNDVTAERFSEKRNEFAPPKPQAVYGRKQGSAATEQRKSRRVDAPNVRLPSVDFRENLPAPSPQSHIRSYGSPNVAESSSEAPKFFRAADGTGMVKFSDGSISQIRSYGSSNAADSQSGAPKFFRAADGTRMVKFSDGSVRVLHPGERSARSDVYRQH
jgi:hypothetical protein